MQGLACPRCFARLNESRCNSCAVNYSQLGDIFWLWPDPVNALLDWRNRFNYHLAKIEAELALAKSDNQAITKARAQEHAKHLERYSAEIRALLSPFNISEPLAP